MKIYDKCKKKNCAYRDIAFKNMSIYCNEHCAAEIKAECDAIATEDFRKVIQALKAGNFQHAGVKGILIQAECILNVADNKIIR